jgi:hypothetical protein
MNHDDDGALPPYAPARSLAELLSFADQEFVECAYWTLLGRAADLDGLAHYTSRLRLGDSRVRIVARLRQSPEGRARAEAVHGLNVAVRATRLAHLPVIGPIFSIILHSDFNTGKARRDRRIENALWRLAYDVSALTSSDMTLRPIAREIRNASNRKIHGGPMNAYVSEIAAELQA